MRSARSASCWDSVGTVIARQDYDPFGVTVLPSAGMPKEGYVGNEADDETQQLYFHARMLSARTGRFGAVDPVFDGMVDPQRWNRYAYAGNNPISLTDPLGLLATFSSSSQPACEQFPIECEETGWGNWFWLDSEGWASGGGGGDRAGGGGGGGWRPPTTSTPTPDPTPDPTPAPTPNPPGPNPPKPPSPPPAPPGFLDKTFSTMRCAANGADRISLANELGLGDSSLGQFFLGNDISAVSNLVSGPGRISSAIGLSGGKAVSLGVRGVGLIQVQPETITGHDTSWGGWESEAYDTGTIAERALGKSLGKVLNGLSEVKLLWDGGTYVGSLFFCLSH